MLSVRYATIEDIPLIRDLTYNVWPQTYTPILGEDQVTYMLDLMYSEQSLQDQIEEQGQHFLIAFDDEAAVGFASYTDMGKGSFKLNKIYVLQNEQGRNIGRFLLESVTERVKAREAEVLYLNVNRYNTAKTFYEKLGFEVVKEEDIDIGSGYYMNDYVMQLIL